MPQVDTSNWYGTTPPVTEDMPDPEDYVRTHTLTEELKSCGVFEEESECLHRYDIIVYIHNVILFPKTCQ